MSQRPTAKCPICKRGGRFAYNAGDRFYKVTDVVVALYTCEACGCLFQDPIPDRDTIADFYPSGYWQETTSPSLMTRLQTFYINTMLQMDLMSWIRRLKLPIGSRFLDVGCSRGDWLALIREAGYEVSGLEADPRAAAYARKQYGIEIEQVDGERWKPELHAFDAMSAFHFLEHVRDPSDFLAKCARALRPGGQLLLRVPNLASWQYKLTRKRWKGLEMPRHLVMFNPKALADILGRNGFKVENYSTWALRDGPPTLASTLFPAGEPTRQQVMGKSNPIATVCYLGLTWLLTPFEILASLLGQGSMITLVARRC